MNLSPAIPTRFGNPVGKHHVIIGNWAKEMLASAGPVSESGFKHLIEATFAKVVGDILAPIKLCDLHVMVLLHSEEDEKPAIIIANKSQGQVDLGWIETAENAPMEWRCAAYRALVSNIHPIIPMITFDDMFEHLSMLYWDGSTEDHEAREALIHDHGHDEEDLEGMTMPSDVKAKAPAWMDDYAGEAPARPFHPELAKLFRDLRKARRRFDKAQAKANPFAFDFDDLCSYAPWYEESYCLPPMTVVPFDIFAEEIDDCARGGMEQGFLDVCGLYLIDPASPQIDKWLETLRASVAVIDCIQRLTAWEPDQHPIED